jgi:hypothetical protein
MQNYLVRFCRSKTDSRFSEVVELPGWWDCKRISDWLSIEFADLLSSGWEVEAFAWVPADCAKEHLPKLEGLDDDS